MVTNNSARYETLLAWSKEVGRNAHDLHDYYIHVMAKWVTAHKTPIKEVEAFLKAPRLRLMDARDYFNGLSTNELAEIIAALKARWGVS